MTQHFKYPKYARLGLGIMLIGIIGLSIFRLSGLLGRGIRASDIEHSFMFYKSYAWMMLALCIACALFILQKLRCLEDRPQQYQAWSKFSCWAFSLLLIDLGVSLLVFKLSDQTYAGDGPQVLILIEGFIFLMLYGAWQFYTQIIRAYCASMIAQASRKDQNLN